MKRNGKRGLVKIKKASNSKKHQESLDRYQESLDKEERIDRMKLPVYNNFDDYVRDHPDGEKFRNWIQGNTTGRGPSYLMLLISPVPNVGHHCQLPGGYLWTTLHELPDILVERWNGKYLITVHDSDDGMTQKICHTKEEGMQEMKILEDLSPFEIFDLEAFGYIMF